MNAVVTDSDNKPRGHGWGVSPSYMDYHTQHNVQHLLKNT